jgi:hypothetical protein
MIFFSTSPPPPPIHQTLRRKRPLLAPRHRRLRVQVLTWWSTKKEISRGKKCDNVKNMIDMETLCIYIIYIYDKYHICDNVTIYHHIIHNIRIDRYKSKYHWRYIIIYRSYDIYSISYAIFHHVPWIRLYVFQASVRRPRPTPTACLHPPSISRV